jgi:pyruvate formate lyase activating enzyme
MRTETVEKRDSGKVKTEAMLYKKLAGGAVRCRLYSHHCKIADSESGFCGVRRNEGGTLYSLVFGATIARHIDSIEKKPLFHFLPGTFSYSIATIRYPGEGGVVLKNLWRKILYG